MLSCKLPKVAAEGNSASEMTWPHDRCPGRCVDGKPDFDEKHEAEPYDDNDAVSGKAEQILR